MFFSKFSVLAAIATMVLGVPISSNTSDGVIQVPLTKIRKNMTSSALVRRDGTYNEPVDQTAVRYFVNYTIGGESQTAILDTGSSDTWCFSNQVWDQGFDPSQSKTYKWDNNEFTAAYGTGSTSVQGTWAEDTVGLGGAEVSNYNFAYLNQSSPYFPDNRGIFGIGPKNAESQSSKYPTYVERLKSSGLVKSNSFSIYSANDEEASLLIGGIDTDKFSGPLYTLPFETIPQIGNYYYAIDFKFQNVAYGGGILDTGTPEILLPQDVADSLAEQYGATWNDDAQGYICSGPPGNNLPSLDFDLGGITVTVPGEDLFLDNGDIYLFGIGRNIDDVVFTANILGDPILKQLYLFFDVDKNEVAFAPIKQSDSSSIVAVSDTIPGAQPAPNQNAASK